MANCKRGLLPLIFTIMVTVLSGCGPIGSKAGSIVMIYGVAVCISLFLLVGCCVLIRKRDPWMLLLFSSVLVVNIGYFAGSVSGTLAEALAANRISYLGAVFLPLSMLMSLLTVTRVKHRHWLPGVLLTVSVLIFLIAASPGYLEIYYKSASLIQVNGVSVLQKEYGPWHPVYLFYLLAYFAAMIVIVVRSNVKRVLTDTVHAVMLTAAVFVNIGVWLLEQLVHLDFEILSVTYIISELFLLGLHMMLQEAEVQMAAASVSADAAESTETPAHVREVEERRRRFEASLHRLTPTERAIYTLYTEGKNTVQVLEAMNIKENTLKYHNKNIYSKLEVSSRKELLALAREVNKEQKDGETERVM